MPLTVVRFHPTSRSQTQDVSLAVRSRVEHGFTRVIAREVLAQQGADTNFEPMPILPKRTCVAQPVDPSMYVPAARGFVGGFDGDHGDITIGEERAAAHSWWHDRVADAASPKGVHEEGLFGSSILENAPKRHKH